jgi:hypothetical protein
MFKSLPGTLLVGLATVLICLVVIEPAAAESGRRRARSSASPRSRSSSAYAPPARSNFRTFSPYDSLRDYYPKYYGGFHERYFTEMLYPTGDRPVRGTAW